MSTVQPQEDRRGTPSLRGGVNASLSLPYAVPREHKTEDTCCGPTESPPKLTDKSQGHELLGECSQPNTL